MSDPESDHPFLLELPPDPAFVATARMFAAAVTREYGGDEGVVEDVKIAVSEAFATTLGSGTAPDRGVRVSGSREGRRVRFEIGTAAPSDGGSRPAEEPLPAPDGFDPALSLELIRALFEDAEIGSQAGRPVAVRFWVPVTG